MNNKRKIAVLTGSRSEYGLLKPILLAINKDKSLELHLIVAAMHLSDQFGNTIEEIDRDGFDISKKIKVTPREDTSEAMASSIGRGIVKITSVLSAIKPDICLIFGDRSEALSGAIAASYSNRVVAHIHGGDSTRAGLDESARHAITKLSHYHFAASKKSAERLVKMGEEPWRIILSGSPGLDDIANKQYMSKKDVINKYHVDTKKPLILLVQHPVTTQVAKAADQMRITFRALRTLGMPTICIYPNADAGGRSMIHVIEKEKKHADWLQTYKSIPRYDYLGLLSTANVLVGNSSSGIIESPSFHLPIVDIGTRQEGRERSTNVIHVSHSASDIIHGIQSALFDKTFLVRVKTCKNPYKKKNAVNTIVHTLSTCSIDDRIKQKKLTY